MQRTATKDTVTRLHDALDMLKQECGVMQSDVMSVTVLHTGYFSISLTPDAYLNVAVHEDARPVTISRKEGPLDYLTFRSMSIHKAYM